LDVAILNWKTEPWRKAVVSSSIDPSPKVKDQPGTNLISADHVCLVADSDHFSVF
jgi:hypothetical protein